MGKCKYLLYGLSGGIDKVKKTLKSPKKAKKNELECFETLKECFDYLTEWSDKWSDENSELKLIYYSYDERIGRNVYMFVRNYGEYNDQFVSFMVHIKKEKNNEKIN